MFAEALAFEHALLCGAFRENRFTNAPAESWAVVVQYPRHPSGSFGSVRDFRHNIAPVLGDTGGR